MNPKSRIAAAAVAACMTLSAASVAMAPPASAATSQCEVTANWKRVPYSSKLTDNSFFHTSVYSRNLPGSRKMEFCVKMIADKKPKGRKMSMTLTPYPFGKVVKASTTGAILKQRVVAPGGWYAVANMKFGYANPASKSGRSTVKEEFALHNFR